jgi:Zn2+/Cd2+-exporting ATPase
LLVVPCTAAIGAWGEGALLLVLFSLSATLENFALGRTRSAIDALLRGAPKQALVVEGNQVREVPVEQIMPGMIVRVMPGQSIPIDLRVTEGESTCDESSLTGESIPVPKKTGDEAFSGTLNLQGLMQGVALRRASESTLSKIIHMIEQAQQMRAPSQRLADKFGTRYTVLVLSSCLLLFLWSWKVSNMPVFFSEGHTVSAFYRAMTLVVASPCALVISVPSAILSAIAYGARHGILFRGGAPIERLHQVTLVALDKTGTLTEGKLRVESAQVFAGSEKEFWAAACSLAQHSTHPIARAVAAECVTRKVSAYKVHSIENVPGQGMTAWIDGQHVKLGNRAFALESHVSATPLTLPSTENNLSEMWVTYGDVIGRFVLRDTLREASPGLIDQMHRDGLQVVMLTGDREAAARTIASAAGLRECRWGLRPEDKVAAIKEFKHAGHIVAMVGDGVNDAPCLAASDVGIAMGARGSDAAIEQADIVLMNDRLENFLLARDLSHRVNRIMRQNIVISLGTMCVMALATSVCATMPLFAGVAMHEGSTAVVVFNSLRLLWNPLKQRKKSRLSPA